MSKKKTVSKFRDVKVVVACVNAAGAADFAVYLVRCTADEYEEDLHCTRAKEQAEIDGYHDGALIAYDEGNGPDWLMDQFEWDEVAIIQVGGGLLREPA